MIKSSSISKKALFKVGKTAISEPETLSIEVGRT
jgi:hypothetical protein